MNLFEVYPLFKINPTKAKGCYIYDHDGRKYLDLYGGHAVISIGHRHPNYIRNTSFIIWSDNSKGAMFESIKINYKKDDFKTEKDFGLGHNLNMRIRSNILKKETQLILDEIEKSGSFKNITDKFKAHNVFKDDDKKVIIR